MTAVYVDAKIDIVDLANSLDAEQFKFLAGAFAKNSPGKDAALTAIAQIRRGDLIDAITTLEREFMPKWGSPAGAVVAYSKAMGTLPFKEPRP